MESVVPVNNKKRVDWVDVLKGLGMIAIFLGHEGASAGKLYLFVFSYHVPLFFFVSGFFSKVKEGESFIQFVKRKFQNIMIPYYGFVFISIIILVLFNNYDLNVLPYILKNGVLGIRNQVFPSSAWFLPCIFLMSIIYNLILRIVKKRNIALACCFIIYIFNYVVYYGPSWFWNLDSALYYIIYYALGASIYPYIQKFKLKSLSVLKKGLLTVLVVFVFAYSAVVYFKGSNIIFSYIPFSFFGVKDVIILISTMIMIFANMFLAILLKNSAVLKNIGQDTLMHFGFEYTIKTLVASGLTWVSLSLDINSPLAALVVSVLLLVINKYTLIRFTEKNLPILTGRYKWVKIT